MAAELAARAALRKGALHLVWGGVGSGKTTEMLVACESLHREEDTWATYIDVSEHMDIGKLRPGSVLLLVASAIASEVGNGGNKAAFSKFVGLADAIGWPPRRRDSLGESVWKVFITPGPAKESGPPPQMVDLVEPLRSLSAALASRAEHQIVFVDSLDRLSDPSLFEDLVRQDLSVIQSAGISAVITGPIRSMYGSDRSIADLFQGLHYQPYIDVRNDADGATFLEHVLETRLPGTVLPPDVRKSLVQWSGGVPRDVVQLAQAACEEAYLAGRDVLSSADAERAGERFGRSLFFGLSDEDLGVLHEVIRTGKLVRRTERELSLLLSRRVLEYPGPRYSVHPTIAPLLKALAA